MTQIENGETGASVRSKINNILSDVEANAAKAGADATATGADRVQTGLDVSATAADRVQTGLDRTATAADRVQTGLDAAAAEADRLLAETARDEAQGYAGDAADDALAAAAAADVLASMALNEVHSFVVETAGAVFPLAFDPGNHKLILTRNGVFETYGVGYTVAGDEVTFNEALRVGDRVSYLVPRPIPFDEGNRADFDTRASFIAANLPEPVNTAVVEGRVWVADADGPITANNGRKWRPAGVVTPGDFGAPGNNVALDTPALLEWADYVARVAKVGYVDKIYRCSAELDFTQGETVAASGITIYGDSDKGCEIRWERMGCDQWWMKFNWMGSTEDSEDVILRNWTARGYYSTLTKDTSNGILGVNNLGWTLANFNITYYGGSALYLTRSFNSDGYNMRLGSGGTQYLRRDDELVASITASSLNFTLSSGTVSADDVGAAIILTKAVPTYPESSSDSRGMANRIATVTSATTGTFETAPFASSSSAAIHFAQARFTSTAASDEITLDAEVLDDGDVGRMVWLVNAGDDGRTLHTTIAEVIDASTARLAVAATRSTSGVFTTSMTLHCGPQPAEYADQPGPPVNDIEFSAIQIEQHYGGGLFLGAGTNAYLSQIKIHGDDVYLTKSGPAIISDCRSNTIHQYHQEVCACAPDEAVIVMGGPRYSLTLTDTTVGEHYANCWFVQHCEVPADTQSVTINGLTSRILWGMMKGVFKGTSAQSGAVNGPLWDIDAAGDNALGTFVAPRQYGDVRLWANASELRVLDGVPAAATDGHMVYNQGNIVAPVSQSGGVPTGGIVQRGVTGAGEYVRFADGTQICWQTETESLASTMALHGGFRTPGQLWTYPANFVSAEVAVLVSVRNSTAFGANAYPDSATRCFWHATTITSEVVAADRTVSLTAIGRWF